MAESTGKTSSKTPAAKTKVTTTSPPASAITSAPLPSVTSVAQSPSPVMQSSSPATSSTSVATQSLTPSAPAPVDWSPRIGVLVSASSVEAAFRNGDAARSVALIQRALIARGIDTPQSSTADYDTRAAYAKFQRTVNERPTGLPTSASLDILGFDVT